jgi:hypothetical protein
MGGSAGGQGIVSRVASLGDNQPASGSVPSYIPPSELSKGPGPVNHIAPMPTMANDLVAPAFEGPRTGGPGMGPPADMVRPAQPVSPVVQQMMQRQMPQFNPYNTGLQSLFNRFMMPQPMMRGPVQMPMYRSPALSYRPNIQQVQQNLGRVKPSVYKSELDTARARIAELEAAQQPRNE